MPTKAAESYYTVVESFVGTIDGRYAEYIAGEVVAADDPGLLKHPGNFKPLVVRERRAAVEQATAVPGESRGR